MGTVVRPNHLVHFKTFELNLKTRELYRNGVRLRLTGHPIDVLAMLLEQPGELVTRESLQKALWPEDTFVDFEHGLNNAINRLREALGDRTGGAAVYRDASTPRLSLHRSGRRIAPRGLDCVGFRTGNSGLASPTGATLLPSPKAQPERLASAPFRNQFRLPKWVVPGFAVLVIPLALATWYLHLPLPPPHIDDPIQITYSGMRKTPSTRTGIICL